MLRGSPYARSAFRSPFVVGLFRDISRFPSRFVPEASQEAPCVWRTLSRRLPLSQTASLENSRGNVSPHLRFLFGNFLKYQDEGGIYEI